MPVLQFLRDYISIRRSGLFMDSAYALRYLRTRRWLIFSLVHYLVVGEKRGFWANPFFNPGFIQTTPSASFAKYIRCRDLWDQSPSPNLAAIWYKKAWMHDSVDQSPLEHFWRIGFPLGLNPSPDFDCEFFKEVVAVYRPDKKEFAYECLGQATVDCPYNEADLIARQKRFQENIELLVVKRSKPSQPFLVFVQAPHDYVDPFSQQERHFDVLINYYDVQPIHCPTADHVIFQKGTKTTAIHKLLVEQPDIFLSYRAVLFLDDDIEIDVYAINRLFDIFEANGLDLAQPSLTEDSFCAFEALKQPIAGEGLRPLTGVEIMMPVVSARALRCCGSAFGEGISGWGVDLLLSTDIRRSFGDTIALIGDVVAAHRRDVDMADGALYRFLRLHGIEAKHEAARIARRFGTSVLPNAITFAGARKTISNNAILSSDNGVGI